MADSEDEATKNFKDRVRIRGNPVWSAEASFYAVRLCSSPTAVHEAILQDQTRHLRSHAEGALQTKDGPEGFTVDGWQTQMRVQKEDFYFRFFIPYVEFQRNWFIFN